MSVRRAESYFSTCTEALLSLEVCKHFLKLRYKLSGRVHMVRPVDDLLPELATPVLPRLIGACLIAVGTCTILARLTEALLFAELLDLLVLHV